MDIQILIAKIEKLQENIKNQSKIPQLDIDLQLSYIRELYDAYLEMKYNFTDTQYRVVEKLEEEIISGVSDCETLPLFEEEGEVGEIGEEGEIGEIGEVGKTEEIEEDEEDGEVEEIGEDVEEESDDEYPVVEMDVEMEFSIPTVSAKPEAVSDIDLDDIEFEFEEDSREEENKPIMPVIQNEPSFPAGISHSRYYGDEIEIENPIPVKPITIGERFKSERPSLNEIVSSYKPDESMGSKLQQGNISDLMKSMDMNNKFMFVKELFKGNGSAFTEEINKLNSFNKLNEAIPYLELIKEKYKWDSQSEAYAELYRLVLRKFAK